MARRRATTIVITVSLAGVLGSLLGGCETRVLTEADCMRVRDRLRESWRRDAVGALREANTDAFRRYIQDESVRMGDRFMTKCEERVGVEVDAKELACLEKAGSIEDVYRCAGR